MNTDWTELLNAFNAGGVRYLVVGGQAVIFYAEPRYTKDIDLWVGTDPTNAEAVYKSLKDFGAPLAGIAPDTFADPDLFYQIGVPPFRVDIIMSIPGVSFDSAWEKRNAVELEGIVVPLIAKDDLIANKIACGRPQDLVDAEALALGRRRSRSSKKR
jgi:hypothetical protein